MFWDLESSSQHSKQSTQKMVFTFLIFHCWHISDLFKLVDPREDKWGKYWNLRGCAFLYNESTVGVGTRVEV